MILSSLVACYEIRAGQGKMPLVGWCGERVSYALHLSADGELLDIVPQLEEVTHGKKTVFLPKRMNVPERVIRSGSKSCERPNLLCDNTMFYLGIDNKGKPQNTKIGFDKAKELHLQTLQKLESTTAKAICLFFEKWDIKKAREHPAVVPFLEELEKGPNLIFMHQCAYAQNDSVIGQAWENVYFSRLSKDLRLCLATGKTQPMARLHNKIKGVSGAQVTGASLISINASAFESYGLCENMPGAPLSEYAAFAYVTALNTFLAGRENRQQIGDTTFLFWSEAADEEMEQAFSWSMFPPPNEEEALTALFQRIAQAKASDNGQLRQKFYVLGLAPNAARLSVRFFWQGTVGKMLDNIQKHYKRLEICKAPHEGEFLSPWHLLNETVNSNSKDKLPSPQLFSGLMKAILEGERYPMALYQATLMRLRAEQDNKERRTQKITRGRAAIIKACLTQMLSENERLVLTVALNEDTTNKAYILGRVFSLLEQTQLAASPDINTTIKDRFFNSACATPAVVFPQLFKLSQNHIAKAEYGKKYERQIATLLERLDAEDAPFPSHLSLQDQGLFVLGYYQQNQARFKKKEEKENGSN